MEGGVKTQECHYVFPISLRAGSPNVPDYCKCLLSVVFFAILSSCIWNGRGVEETAVDLD